MTRILNNDNDPVNGLSLSFHRTNERIAHDDRADGFELGYESREYRFESEEEEEEEEFCQVN